MMMRLIHWLSMMWIFECDCLIAPPLTTTVNVLSVCECAWQWILAVVLHFKRPFNCFPWESEGEREREREKFTYFITLYQTCRCITKHLVMPNFAPHFLFINACLLYFYVRQISFSRKEPLANAFEFSRKCIFLELVIALSVWIYVVTRMARCAAAYSSHGFIQHNLSRVVFGDGSLIFSAVVSSIRFFFVWMDAVCVCAHAPAKLCSNKCIT